MSVLWTLLEIYKWTCAGLVTMFLVGYALTFALLFPPTKIVVDESKYQNTPERPPLG